MLVDAKRVREAFEAEDHGRSVTRAEEVPPNYASITGQWLDNVLCSDNPDAHVTDFSFDERDDGSSNRRRIFLSYNAAGDAAGLPRTVFCKAAETLENRLVLGVSETAKAEADFYNLVQPRLSIPTPTPRYARFDPETFAYMIMMDDMADKAAFPDERTTLTRRQAEQMVETLAGLHSRFHESDELGTESIPFKRWPAWWAEMMHGAPDFPDFCDRGFETIAPQLPEGLRRRRAEVWLATEKSVARHNELPHTLIHSDVHLKNWFLLPDDRMGLHDWQVVTIGHWSRDFVFATTTALTIEQRRDWQLDLLRLYLERMQEHGVPPVSFDDAFLNIRQQLMTAFAFWTITMCPTGDMPAMQPERTTVEFLRRFGAAMDDYNSLDAF
ncbi:hypothetical protein GCM10011371_02710 [Novosphingobium marinum]|uniref:Aminoglycoside phosphotransferase domain-containing protein n=1 Tax=Novosphingobium marinum TaxID=1514948 RepID=A0A7Z0BTD1_9SPHN|nr:aminoglycoside phosphotransferase family protein [Novosphingobium marinum]NYH93963.1 hypothetical protein [Novosphingobium marinum]GGC18595.1 hypothetical protein GCM10011371_02710 [Novosphingobium marinum]